MMRHSASLRPLARCSGHPRPSRVRPQCTVGVLAGTHWNDDSSKVMSHQSANPLWLCRASGHGRDRGRELSCGLFIWTSFIHAFFKQTSSFDYHFDHSFVVFKCGRVVLGQGAKVLSGSTQGLYPRHHGS